MARICELTGKGPMKGSIIWRSGKSKKSGGIGTHVTAITKRRFLPNLQRVKALINGEVRYVRLNSRVKAILSMLKPAAGPLHDVKNPRGWFERAVKDSGLSDFHWHDLRHTFISRLVMAGVDLRTVQELAGHKTIQMTMRYAHLAPSHLATAVEKLCERTATITATDAGGTVATEANFVQ